MDTTKPPERPDWLYGQGCCEHWTPLGGCSDGHTGRPAMSLLARTTDDEADS